MALCSNGADELRGLSLCAGYGGLDLGIEIAEPGYRTVCYVEREAHAAATLVARMAEAALAAAPVWDDLKSFDGAPWRGRIHILSAGYPCQPFSACGHKRGEADPRHLWPDVARIVDEVRPEWVFAENVEGHIDLGFTAVRDELARLGYHAKAGLFSAAEVGASHGRRRLFILAHADGARQWQLERHVRDIRSNPDDIAVGLGAKKRREIPAQGGSANLDDHVDAVPIAWPEAEQDLRGPEGLFVPGPDQLENWTELLSLNPAAQPALLRDDYGVASQLDRSRGVGNGVCSLEAAFAFHTLKTAFFAETANE